MARRIIEWIPYGNRRGKGRPGTRWEDEINNRVGVACVREVWRRRNGSLANEKYKKFVIRG